MKKYAFLTIVGLVIIGAVLYAFLHATKSSVQSPLAAEEQSNGQATASTTKIYKNGTYGFTLAYPAALQEKAYGQSDVVFGNITGENVQGVAEAQVMIVQGNAGETFGQAAARELKNLCDADGPTTTFSCTAVEKIQPFPSTSGTLGLEFYLRGELKALKTGKITVIEKGPYYAFSIQTGATGSSVLVVHPPLNQSAAEAASSTIEAIAKSVQFDASQKGDVLLQAYISQHLSELSSVKETVGGKFYVTKIEAKDGKGTVNYEDGHNAYVADFLYSTNSSGTMTVTSFKVRK
ncbi:MAG: hypothetical protein JWO00_316 [Candidatus Parcubacteria bacterium]|nr:hypothetical protein [Candidatus Parcubacteria bacterium]